jgi:nitrogen fixation protein FixH
MTRELTGRHVLFIFVAAFGVIIAVNLTLAFQAVSTFPGLEVKNSYVASQTFDAERAAQERLGWTVETRVQDGVLRLSFTDATGAPADVAAVAGLLGRTTVTTDDQTPEFERTGPATFEAPVSVARGHWMFRLNATAGDGTAFRKRVSIPVR